MKTDFSDISGTLFQADAIREGYVELSEEDAEPGTCGRLIRSMRSTRDEAQNWGQAYIQIMTSTGFQAGHSYACGLARWVRTHLRDAWKGIQYEADQRHFETCMNPIRLEEGSSEVRKRSNLASHKGRRTRTFIWGYQAQRHGGLDQSLRNQLE